MKHLQLQRIASVLAITLLISLNTGCSASWEKKQFDTPEQFGSAFSNARYKNVKAAFGEPYYKRLNVVEQTVMYRWRGVGVKGKPDAFLVFSAKEYGYFQFVGDRFEYFYSNGEVTARSNDHEFNID